MIKHQETGAFFCTIKQALTYSSEILNSPLEAQILLSFVLKKDPVYLYTWPDKELAETQKNTYLNLIKRRKNHEPIAYITGIKEFYGIPFKVKPGVLIPRPETEELIEIINQEVGRQSVLDLCCGSGAIGLTLKKLNADWEITLSDISEKAIEVTKENSENLGLNVQIIKSDLFNQITGSFDIIVSNPPYISEEEFKTLSEDIRDYEPHKALLAGEDGLAFYRLIAQQANQYLKPNGKLIVEIGYKQGETVKKLFEAAGFVKVSINQDLSGYDRIVIALKNPQIV